MSSPSTAPQVVVQPPSGDPDWWRSATIYQIYVRSFADSDGDGVGDIEGIRRRLDYLESLSVDAIWITPWYPSPLADGGYDVADYRAIHPLFGDLAQAERLIAEALEHGIRTIIDVVPNHISSEHPWFRQALAAAPGDSSRDLFWFRDGRGPGGDEPPTNWISEFGGTTWTRTTNTDGTPGQWYLHVFSPEQPDLNWSHPQVRAEHEDILRFWFDRGVAGVRIDSAAQLVKDPTLPDLTGLEGPGAHPHVDRDDLHDIYRGWRGVADSYEGARVLVGEVWLPDPRRFAKYLRPDELHTAFNFDFMTRPWDARSLRDSIDGMLAAHAPVDAPATWVLSNHDVTRPATRYGREDTAFSFATKRFGTPTDEELGLRRARAAALLVAALPGSMYVYQGDELGLPEAEIPRELIEDPMHARSGGVDPGRDGCRVPLPWSSHGASLGFGPPHALPWLPQPADWERLSVARQASDPRSTLSLYRRALWLRRHVPALRVGEMAWLEAPDGVLAFSRGEDVVCLANLTSAPVDLPAHREVLVASAPLPGDRLPPDSAVWLRR